MYNFFIEDEFLQDIVTISGSNFNHIKNVLRFNESDTFLISHNGQSHLYKIESFSKDSLTASLVEKNYLDTSLPIEIYLFQGLPKSDKLELIIQKTVELGVSGIYPVSMERSIVKLDDKKAKDKTQRWQAISESAAKQSKRTFIPKVNAPITFNQMLSIVKDFDLFLVPYENELGMKETISSIKDIKSGMKIGILIGPEGGISENEVEKVKTLNAKLISLGKRILRTETAAMLSVGAVMLYAESYLN